MTSVTRNGAGSEPAPVLLVEMCIDGTVGGSHNALEALVTRLDSRRFRPLVLFYQDNPLVARFRERGIGTIVWDDLRRREMAAVASRWPGLPHLTVLGAIWRRAMLLRRLGVRILHLNNSPELGFYEWVPAAWLARVPCLTHCRGNVGSGGKGLRRRLRRGFARVVAVSDHVHTGVVASGIEPGRVTRIYDGLDVAAVRDSVRASRAAVRRALGTDPDDLVLVMVGNIRRWKGQRVLLDAVAALPAEIRRRVRVWLVGADAEPDYGRELRSAAAASGIADRVGFLGFRTDAADLVSAADVAVHASTRAEPFGLVIVEAMALGTPVVAPALGGPVEILAGGGGVLYQAGDAADLSTKLLGLLRDRQMGASLAREAVRRASAFDIRLTVTAVETLYDELLDRHGVGRDSPRQGG